MAKLKPQTGEVDQSNFNRTAEIEAEGLIKRNKWAFTVICILVLSYGVAMIILKDSQNAEKLLASYSAIILPALTAICGFVAGRSLPHSSNP